MVKREIISATNITIKPRMNANRTVFIGLFSPLLIIRLYFHGKITSYRNKEE